MPHLTASVKPLHSATATLVAVCNWVPNGDDFQLADAWLAHALADLPANRWNEQAATVASGLVQRYAEHLAPFGITVDTPKVTPEQVQQARAVVLFALDQYVAAQVADQGTYLYYQGAHDRVVMRLPNKLSLIAQAKTIKGWRRGDADGEYAWTSVKLPELVAFADKHNIAVPQVVRGFAEALDWRRDQAPRTDLAELPNVTLDPAHPGTVTILADYHPHTTPKLNAELKALNGGRSAWDLDARVHRVPYRVPEAILDVADRYRLSMSPEAYETLHGEYNRQAENRRLATMVTGMPPLAVPGLARNQRILDTQWPAVHFAVQNLRVIIGDDVGWGKTPTALAALAHRQAYPAVVVCPPSLTRKWAKEIGKFFPFLNVYAAEGHPPATLPDDVDVVVIGFNTLASRVAPPVTLTAQDRQAAREYPAARVDATAARIAARYLVDRYGSIAAAAQTPQTVLLIEELLSGNRDTVSRDDEKTLVDLCRRAPSTFEWVERLRDLAPQALVIDEGQSVKEAAALRSQAVFLLSRAIPADGMVLDLTGTAIVNRPKELVTQLEILGRIDELGGTKAVLWRYCLSEVTADGKARYEGRHHLDELNRLLTGLGIMVRRWGSEALGLPPVRHIRVDIDPQALDPKIMADYRLAEADIAAYLAEEAARLAAEAGVAPSSDVVRRLMRRNASLHLIRLTKLRQLIGWAKQAYIANVVHQYTKTRQKVIVAAHHRGVVDAYANQFGGLKIQGGQSVDAKEADKARFQTDPDANVITITDTAGQTGHDLTAADVGILAEQVWTPGERHQIQGRGQRIGRTGQFTFVVPIVTGTIDEWMDDLVNQKAETLHAVLNGTAAEGVDDTAEDGATAIAWRYAQQGLKPGLRAHGRRQSRA